MAYIKKIWKDYPDTSTPITADDLNNIEDGIEASDTSLSSGWISANETWTYASVDDPTGVITISGDKTTKYSLGMRIKFTNATNVIYGIITAISYSSPNTTMTFLHEIDPTDSLALHLMVDSAITNNYYSSMKAPFGFPTSMDKWQIILNNTNSYTSVGATTPTNINPALSISLPIGFWKCSYGCRVESTGLGNLGMNNAILMLNTTFINETKSWSATNNIYLQGSSYISTISKQFLYLANGYAWTGGNTDITIDGSDTTYGIRTIIKAECAYL